MYKTTKLMPSSTNQAYVKMEHFQGKLWGILPALVGGLSKYFLQIGNASWMAKVSSIVITAFVCGLIGAAGKYVFDTYFVVAFKKLIIKIKKLWQK